MPIRRAACGELLRKSNNNGCEFQLEVKSAENTIIPFAIRVKTVYIPHCYLCMFRDLTACGLSEVKLCNASICKLTEA